MSSFEFYGRETYASCQYHVEEFFMALDGAGGEYPLLARACSAFKALQDDVFSHAKGETRALEKEIHQIVQALELDLHAPAGKYVLFALIAKELEAVFAESKINESDIKFRWG